MSAPDKPPTRLLSWPPPIELLWLALPCVILVALIGSAPIQPYDVWWPIVQGRAVDQLGFIPQQNLYLYTVPADAPFHNQPWLAQWLMWHLFRAGSTPALAYTALALFVATLLLTLRTALEQPQARARLVAPVALIIFIIDSARWMPRTQMFATPLFALFFWALLRYLDGRMSRRALLLMLAPMMLLWANLHGSFFLTLLLLIAASVGQALESWSKGSLAQDARALAARWLPPLAVCSLVPMLNPRGPAIYAYVVMLSLDSHVSKITAEWLPLTVSDWGDVPLLLCIALPALITLIAARAAGWPRVFMVWGFAIMTFRSTRTALWWPLLLTPILPPLLLHLYHSLLTRQGKPIPPAPALAPGDARISAAALLALLIPVFMYLPGVPLVPEETLREQADQAEVFHPDDRYLTYGHPLSIGPKLAQRGYPGYIFHDASIAGYLELVLTADAPRQVTFVDQRVELIPPPIWRIHRHLSAAKLDWNAEFDKRFIQTALLNVRLQRPLQRALEADPRWRRVAVDHIFALYMRADAVPPAWADDPSRDLPIPAPSVLDEQPLNADAPPLLDTQHGLPDRPPAPR